MTPEETAFFEYATALCDWLAPYHEYSRPPADAVLAEADKQSQLRAKGINPSFSDGPITVTNGIVKKDEEPPAFQEPPTSLVDYFDGPSSHIVIAVIAWGLNMCYRRTEPLPRTVIVGSKFVRALGSRHTRAGGKSVPRVVVHVDTDYLQALICFTIETLRFRNAALVKAYKFSAVRIRLCKTPCS